MYHPDHVKAVKRLHEELGVGLFAAKNALVIARWDVDEAIRVLHRWEHGRGHYASLAVEAKFVVMEDRVAALEERLATLETRLAAEEAP